MRSEVGCNARLATMQLTNSGGSAMNSDSRKILDILIPIQKYMPGSCWYDCFIETLSSKDVLRYSPVPETAYDRDNSQIPLAFRCTEYSLLNLARKPEVRGPSRRDCIFIKSSPALPLRIGSSPLPQSSPKNTQRTLNRATRSGASKKRNL